MSTLIICPACGTRYEIAAVIPPEGRKVRCSKCSHVWQATAVIETAKPPVAAAPRGPAPVPAPRVQPMPPRPAPVAPRPAPPAANVAMGGFAGLAQKQPNGAVPIANPPRGAATDTSFDGQDEFQADLPGAAPAWSETQAPARTNEPAQDFGSYNAGTLVNPDLAQANIPIGGERKKPKVRPVVAIGWGALALPLVILAAMLALAPKTVVSVLPGATRLYAMLGKPVGGLAIQDVHTAWNDAGAAPVLTVEGTIVNLSSGTLDAPPLVIALQDATGKQIAEFTSKVAPLAAGARAPFMAQIPSPPSTVSSLKVRFAKAS
jgi:predicted Zn finger-like uncharacterized protein